MTKMRYRFDFVILRSWAFYDLFLKLHGTDNFSSNMVVVDFPASPVESFLLGKNYRAI